MIFFGFIFLLFNWSWAQVSVCAPYNIEASPSSVRSDQFIKCMQQGDVFYFDGVVDEFLIYELKDFAEKPIKKLFLNSVGGVVEDAIKVAEWVRSNNVETYVRKDAVCMSACTLIFQAGVRRQAHSSAKFMFHGARYLPKNQYQLENIAKCVGNDSQECQATTTQRISELWQSTNRLFALYEAYGATKELFATYKARPLEKNWAVSGNYIQIDNWYMSAEEALQFNVVQKILE